MLLVILQSLSAHNYSFNGMWSQSLKRDSLQKCTFFNFTLQIIVQIKDIIQLINVKRFNITTIKVGNTLNTILYSLNAQFGMQQ